MLKFSSATLFAVSTLALSLPLQSAAAGRFEDWRTQSLQSVADRAAIEARQVVVVISQPDWCPPCIRLDSKWLKNPEETAVSGILRDALLVEIHGYDEPDASILRKHGIAFRGTPTTHVFAPSAPRRPLGEAPLRGSIIGAPDDYPEQLRALLAGEDPIEDLLRRIDREDDKLERQRLRLQLGDLHAARGDKLSTYLAYRHVRRTRESRLSPEEIRELDEIKRDAAWRQADTAMLRVRKNYPEAYEDIVAYENGHPWRAEEQGRIAYSKAWAMAQMGDVPGALAVLDAGLADDADGAESFLYFCFRSGHRTALVAGERKAKEAMWRWPERRAAWMEGLGRIQRRQGRFPEAEASFAEAVALESDPEVKLTYQGQLDHVRGERTAIRALAAEQENADGGHDDHDDRSGHGEATRRTSAGLGR